MEQASKMNQQFPKKVKESGLFGELTFVCNFCQQLFKDEGHLQNHLKIRHPKERSLELAKTPAINNTKTNKRTLSNGSSHFSKTRERETVINNSQLKFKDGDHLQKICRPSSVVLVNLVKSIENGKKNEKSVHKTENNISLVCESGENEKVSPFFKLGKNKGTNLDQKANEFEKEKIGLSIPMVHVQSKEENKSVKKSKAPYSCFQCEKSFRFQTNYEKHMRELKKPGASSKRFNCTLCDKWFNSSICLCHHMISHSNKKSYKPFKYRQILKHKKSTAKSYTCKFCNKSYAKIHLLKMHSMFVHKKHKFFKCHECAQVFSSKFSLGQHVGIHSKIKFQCKLCNKIFYKQHILKSHLKIIHELTPEKYKENKIDKKIKDEIKDEGVKTIMRDGKKLFRCSVCEKVFIHCDELKTHLRIHSGKMPYKCEACGESFNGRIYYQEHKTMCKSCPQKAAVVCSVCGLQVSTKQNLSVHMLTHIDEKFFKCLHCGRSFRRKDYVLSHIKRKHPHDKDGIGLRCESKLVSSKYNKSGKRGRKKNSSQSVKNAETLLCEFFT